MTNVEAEKTLHYIHYDSLERSLKLTKAQVIAIVKKHNLPKRKIWGAMAVDADAFELVWNKTVAQVESDRRDHERGEL